MKQLWLSVLETLFEVSMSGNAFAGGRGGNSSPRPYYGGGNHTTSHGGTFVGGVGSSHLGGVYVNSNTGNRYGIH